MTSTSNSIITLRRHDLDNLRTFLTSVVIIHHTSCAYGGAGYFRYASKLIGTTSPNALIPLTVLNAFNQSYFMGLFFWISGRVSAQSLNRLDNDPSRSRWSFAKSKCLRLGLVSVVYTLAVCPVVSVVALPSWNKASILGCLKAYFSTLRGIRGPVWYTGTLLLLDLAAATFSPRRPIPESKTKEGKSQTPDNTATKLPLWYSVMSKYGWIATALISFLVRLRYPVGSLAWVVEVMPAYLPQYLFAYSMGHASWTFQTSFEGPVSGIRRYFSNVNKREAAFPGLLTSCAISLSALVFSGSILFFQATDKDWLSRCMRDFGGGWNLSAFLYALWNEFSFMMIAPALIEYFSAHFNSPCSTEIFKPKYSYASFILHSLVSVAVEIGFDYMLCFNEMAKSTITTSTFWNYFSPTALTALVGSVNVYASFYASNLVLNTFPRLQGIL